MRFKIRCLFFFVSCFIGGMTVFSQNPVSTPVSRIIDSLERCVAADKKDSTRMNHLNTLILEYQKEGKITKALELGTEAIQLGRNLPKEEGAKALAKVNNAIGNIYRAQANFPEALKSYREGLDIANSINHLRLKVVLNSNIGYIYCQLGKYEKSLEHLYLANKLMPADRNNDIWRKIAEYLYANFGVTYESMHNMDEALRYYTEDFKLKTAANDIDGLADSYHNMANVYFDKGKNAALKDTQEFYMKKSLDFYQKAKKINESNGNNYWLLNNYKMIGAVYLEQKLFEKALENQKYALSLYDKTGDELGLMAVYYDLGLIYEKMGQRSDARKHHIMALDISKKIGYLYGMQVNYQALASLDSADGNYKGAFNNNRLFLVYKDSLQNDELNKKLVETKLNSEFEMKEALLKAEQEKKDNLAELEKQRQKTLFTGALILLLMALVFSWFVYRAYRQKQQDNRIISEQKNEVEKQKHIIEAKNKDITDSIDYAQLIQEARLPKQEDIRAELPDSFVLYKPKAVVSGDFYYFEKQNNKLILAAADCTGHGVPGALMSMIGSEKLEEAVRKYSEPAQILKQLNNGIKSSLRQSEVYESNRDGMDIALCSIQPSSHTLSYAGANRPLWIVRNNATTVEEIKPTKRTIAGFTETDQLFEQHEIKLNKGDSFYIFSDGYTDLFGGSLLKKLTTGRLKELLLQIQHQSMLEQQKALQEFALQWQGAAQQVDDILIIGVRLS